MAAGSRRQHARNDEIELITDARKSPLEGWHRRRRLYVILQAIRFPLFISSGLVWWLTGSQLWAVLIVVISVPLPWVAVLLANETGEVDKKSRSVYKPGLVREQRRRLEEEQRQALESGSAGVLSARPGPEIIDIDDSASNDDDGNADNDHPSR